MNTPWTNGKIESSDLALVVGLRLLLGVAEAFFFVAGFAAVADLAPPDPLHGESAKAGPVHVHPE